MGSEKVRWRVAGARELCWGSPCPASEMRWHTMSSRKGCRLVEPLRGMFTLGDLFIFWVFLVHTICKVLVDEVTAQSSLGIRPHNFIRKKAIPESFNLATSLVVLFCNYFTMLTTYKFTKQGLSYLIRHTFGYLTCTTRLHGESQGIMHCF